MPIVVRTHKTVIGIDEAGRGPLAGPVVSSAVIIKKRIPEVADSKSLTSEKREALFNLILNEAVAFGIGIASVEEIEKMNILNATLLSMKRALNSLLLCYKMKYGEEISDFIVLIDGNRKIKEVNYPQKTIVSGDKSIYEISAASIIAKVVRDRIMKSYSKRYPDYGFEIHKGYATEFHREQVLKLGPCPIHRKKFLTNLLYGEQKLFR